MTNYVALPPRTSGKEGDMMRMRFEAIWLATILLSPALASAQPLEEEDLAMAYGDKATVSIATGGRQDLRRAPAVAHLSRRT